MKKAEKKAVETMPGRVLGRVLAEELEQARGGYSPPLLGATGSKTVQDNGNLDFTGGRPGQTDGD
ncbi:hypothetical protein [Vitiosangium sp. GDMCC 1.1324]|uniref:hypothetical protein n=1 Tax=Vitiosangium sp. (strain GDMCC 1.1324) TaxID=2138576 RepID=UPI000D36E40D|nr:hypothetical protein [Vitiosangium sp. GDMCC 1.1324]PTL83044.1 hypothetical protein DAT35_13580 [Vitiosangium sp. GDMCC 1.1324]